MISIGNGWRSGRTCGTAYWITLVRHEAARCSARSLAWVVREGNFRVISTESVCRARREKAVRMASLPISEVRRNMAFSADRAKRGVSDTRTRWRVLECPSKAHAHTPR
ncbi:hypothetical protein KP509_1Z191400, partial [Ceratopteris richardii]